MKKFFIENENRTYTVEKVTAIAVDIEDSVRQPALLVGIEDCGSDADYVVFGFDMPDDMDDFLNMCDEPNAWTSQYEVLNTVMFNDGSVYHNIY